MGSKKILEKLKKMRHNGYWTRGDDEGYGSNGWDCAIDEIEDFIKDVLNTIEETQPKHI